MDFTKGFRIGTLYVLGTLISLLSVSSFAQSGVGGGGGTSGTSGSSNWQVSSASAGTDTFVFPKFDATQGIWRLYTYVHTYSTSGTNSWTEDGNALPGIGPTQASWSSPTSFSGSADSNSQTIFTVHWNGTGPAPQYMYLAITSSAHAWSSADTFGGSYSGSNGQGDYFLVYAGSGTSSGTHAKRLTLDSNGTAQYSVSMSSHASMTGTSASLYASNLATADLNPKALGLTKETFEREEYNDGSPQVRRVSAASTDFENQTCVIGAHIDWADYGWSYSKVGIIDTTFPIMRLGSWLSFGGPYDSAVSEGTKTVNLDYPAIPVSMNIHKEYPLDELMDMRTNPKTLNLWFQQSDPGSSIQGPFKGNMVVKIWAPARLRTSNDYEEETNWAEPSFLGPNGNSTIRIQLTETGQTGSISFSITQTDTFKFPVGLSTGVTLSGDLLTFLKASVKADISKQVGDAQGFNITGGASFTVGPCESPVEEWGLQYKVRTYSRDRYQSAYSDDGYDNDFADTIVNTAPANIIVKPFLYSSGLPGS